MLNQIIIKMSKKGANLARYFLKNSPLSQYRCLSQIITFGRYINGPPMKIQSDEEYEYEFFDRLEISGPSNANFNAIKIKSARGSYLPRSIFPSVLVAKKATPGSWEEPEQLNQSIKEVSQKLGEGIIPLQELEQRLEIAAPETIAEMRAKLIYLFKILINKRDKIHPNSLELDANLHLSQAIIAALSRIQSGNCTQKSWKQLEAMEKLLRAREYQKNGLKQIALNNFEQICRDQAASSKTRLQALKVLCSSGEELGDPRLLQSLIPEMRAFGEKQCEQIILRSLSRIKGAKG